MNDSFRLVYLLPYLVAGAAFLAGVVIFEADLQAGVGLMTILFGIAGAAHLFIVQRPLALEKREVALGITANMLLLTKGAVMASPDESVLGEAVEALAMAGYFTIIILAVARPSRRVKTRVDARHW